MKRFLRLKRLGQISVFLFVFSTVTMVHASQIGTLSTARANLYSQFNLFGGSYFGHAINSLNSNGHTVVDLASGISNSSLSSIDLLYLPLTQYSQQILTGSEITAIQNFVSSGKDVVVQADYTGYNNLLSAFGITHNGMNITAPSTSITTSYAPITNGPYGNVSSFQLASASSFTLPSGGIMLDQYGVLSVLYGGAGLVSGSGRLVLLGDINSFDGPGNTNGFTTLDGGTLFQNVMSLPVPEPLSMVLYGAGLLGLAGFKKIKKTV